MMGLPDLMYLTQVFFYYFFGVLVFVVGIKITFRWLSGAVHL